MSGLVYITSPAFVRLLSALGGLLLAVGIVAALAVLLDLGAAQSAAAFEQATGRTYADLCASGISGACDSAERLARWGLGGGL